MAPARRAPGGVVGLATALILSFASSCALVLAPAQPAHPLPETAVQAFAEAQLHLRSDDDDALTRARESALRACRLAPRWAAPRRVLDDVDRVRLLGPELIARYEARLRNEPADAFALYLAGRLEVPARSEASFRRAIAADSDFAWGHHGLSWARAAVGDVRGAIEAENRALQRARGSWERSYFTDSLSRHYAAMGKDSRALGILLRRLAESDVLPVDRITLGVRAAVLELGRPYGKSSQQGVRRGLALLHVGGLTARETEELVAGILRTADAGGRVTSSELRVALRAVEGPSRDKMLALLLMREAPTPLALGLLERAMADDRSELALNPGFRAVRFATGEVAGPIEEWLELQPALVLDASGLPRDPGLAWVVQRARLAEKSRANPDLFVRNLARLGDALVGAGWFEDAHGLAQELARHDIDLALELDDRASAGRALIDSVVDVVERVDAREPIGLDTLIALESSEPSRGRASSADLEVLLDVLEPHFQRYRDIQSDARRGERVDLAQSPRLSYGPVGSVVHPGPLFSAEDESIGLGVEGERVGGLARELDRIGRFGVFGEALGSGPDGTVLRRLLVEERSGEHLGTSWSGTVAWCEGADLLSRPGRRGARIGGAALHEGYWIDIGTLRGEERHLRDLEEMFFEDEGLAVEALDVRPARRSANADPRELPALLGEADRVRLAVLFDRRDEGRARPLVPLDELVAATAAHEEGHLCDRSRFLPLSRRFFAVVGFFVSSGLSASRVEERLEYRAQLTALCSMDEARLCLAEILAASEQGTGGVTPHGAAYTKLLRDFVAVLDDRLDGDRGLHPRVDPEGELAHQLHRLSTEEVREIALVLARDEGLVAE